MSHVDAGGDLAHIGMLPRDLLESIGKNKIPSNIVPPREEKLSEIVVSSGGGRTEKSVFPKGEKEAAVALQGCWPGPVAPPSLAASTKIK